MEVGTARDRKLFFVTWRFVEIIQSEIDKAISLNRRKILSLGISQTRVYSSEILFFNVHYTQKITHCTPVSL